MFEQICRIENKYEITIPAKGRIFRVCRDNWKERPSDFMLEFDDVDIKKHIPMPERKEILSAK